MTVFTQRTIRWSGAEAAQQEKAGVASVLMWALMFVPFGLSAQTLEPRETVRIDRVAFTGNWKTKVFAVRSELLFEDGDEVNLAIIEESIQRLRNRGYFYEVDWELVEEAGQTVLNISVRERWTTFPVVYFDTSDLYTTVMLGGYDQNLAGLGFELLLTYTGLYYRNTNLHNFSLRYGHPRLGGTRFSLEVVCAADSLFSYLADPASKKRFDAYLHRTRHVELVGAYEWPGRLETALILGFAHDIHDPSLPADEGYTGFDSVEEIPAVGLRVAWDRIDLVDQRRSGFLIHGEGRVRVPVGGTGETFFVGKLEGQYHHIFAREWLNLSTRLRLDYSSASIAPYRMHRGEFLRGGDGMEYHSRWVAGVSGELGVAPIRRNWLFLELTGFIDLAWGGNAFAAALKASPMLRVGPGARASWPPIAGLYLSFDYGWSETGDPSFRLSMVRFF